MSKTPGYEGTIWPPPVGHPNGTASTLTPSTPQEATPIPFSGIPGLVRLSDVQPEIVQWLWRGRIPLGKLTILEGDPGLGKSLIACDVAARVSSGRSMPDGTYGDLDGPAGVVILSAEDGLADTIRPRLDQAGAECEHIAAFTFINDGTAERMPTLADLHEIELVIAATDAKLVIVDPLMAYLPGATNSYRDQDVRSILAPLSKRAERMGVAVLVVRHLTKGAGGGNPLYRGGGSIGIAGAARSVLLVAPDPDDETKARRILAMSKSNLAKTPPALAYRLEGREPGAPVVYWEGATNHTADSLLAVPQDADGRDALTEAQQFLEATLDNGPQPSEEIQKEARKVGIADTTLRRARAKLGIKPNKEGFGKDGRWWWRMPDQASSDQEADP